MTRIWIVAAGLALAQPGGPGIREICRVDFRGQWKDPDNFSGAAAVGGQLLVAIDEHGFLQTGAYDRAAGTVTRGRDVELAAGAIGTKIELDIEALAASGTTVFALGSHSATRSSGDDRERKASENLERLKKGAKANPVRDVIVTFTYDAATGAASGLETKSLRKAIAAHELIAPFAALAGKENGVDFEGLAVDGTTLFAGLRGPVLRHGFAPVLRFTFASPETATLLLVPLDGRGIRDMAKVDDGLLLLAGPVGDGDAPHRLYRWNAKDCVPGTGGAGGQLAYLGDIPAPVGSTEAQRLQAKAEAILVLGQSPAHYELLVLYDGLDKGGATRFEVPRAAARATAATQLCGA